MKPFLAFIVAVVIFLGKEKGYTYISFMGP